MNDQEKKFQIAKRMKDKGHSNEEIADVLNEKGFTGRGGVLIQPKAVEHLLYRSKTAKRVVDGHRTESVVEMICEAILREKKITMKERILACQIINDTF